MKISNFTGFILADPTNHSISFNLENANYFKIETLSDLESALVKNQDLIIKLAQDIKGERSDTVSCGISIFYLSLILAGKLGEVGALEFLEKAHIGKDRKVHAAYLVKLVK